MLNPGVRWRLLREQNLLAMVSDEETDSVLSDESNMNWERRRMKLERAFYLLRVFISGYTTAESATQHEN